MEITKEIIELAKKAHYTTVELFELAHAFEVTHPGNAEALLVERLKQGRPAEPFGKRFHELVAARRRLWKLIEVIGGAAGELQVLHTLIGELEPKAVEAEQKRRETRREQNAARRAREGA